MCACARFTMKVGGVLGGNRPACLAFMNRCELHQLTLDRQELIFCYTLRVCTVHKPSSIMSLTEKGLAAEDSQDEDSGHDSADSLAAMPVDDRERIVHLETAVAWIKEEMVS